MATVLFLLIVFFRTVDSICKLLARKCEKRSVKRKIFVLLDLGKAKKYLYELDAAAKNIEVRQSNCPCTIFIRVWQLKMANM